MREISAFSTLTLHHAGDTLAVVLLYAALLSVRKTPPARAALCAFGCACALELGQAFDLVEPRCSWSATAALFMSNSADFWPLLHTKSRHRARPPGTLQ